MTRATPANHKNIPALAGAGNIVFKIIPYFHSPPHSLLKYWWVGRALRAFQVEVCFLCYCLVSRRCHNISTYDP